MIGINGLRGLARRLDALNLAATEHSALQQAATSLQNIVRQNLSHGPGGTHDVPWLRSGALRDSIGHTTAGAEAVVGSRDPVAVYQECGTHRDPPRPFLAPAASTEGPHLAVAIAAEVVSDLRAVFR